MLANELFGFRSQLRRSGTMFAYCGYVTEPVLSGVGDALKQRLVIEDTDTKTVRSVFAVFVEQMQNIIRYSAEKGGQQSSASDEAGSMSDATSELRYGIVTIGRDADGFIVKAGNLVDKRDVAALRAKLEQIRGADRDTLKAMYKETLRAEPAAGSKGAGVGFIEIARRASKPIAFDFAEVDDRFAFFALEAGI
ncbi:MAG: SiaB family protein kinase [Alphaproteobacteria bacterium]|nr:SiaB family protein kinase [Alphaproteobacteria bacterium]